MYVWGGMIGDHSTKLPEVKINKNEEYVIQQQVVNASQGMGAGIGGLPSPNIGGSNHVSTGLVIPFSSDADASEMSGHLMLDCVGGVCYEYLLDREAILNIFTSHSGQSHIQALHLAIVHMQDNELVDQILTYLCRNFPSNIVTPLLREFLIGSFSFPLSLPFLPSLFSRSSLISPVFLFFPFQLLLSDLLPSMHHSLPSSPFLPFPRFPVYSFILISPFLSSYHQCLHSPTHIAFHFTSPLPFLHPFPFPSPSSSIWSIPSSTLLP